MIENICYTDAYARMTEASVVEVDEEANSVLLERRVSTPAVATNRPIRAP